MIKVASTYQYHRGHYYVRRVDMMCYKLLGDVFMARYETQLESFTRRHDTTWLQRVWWRLTR